MDFHRCPENADALADAYATGRLALSDAAAFEEHYIGCPRCSDRFQFTGHFVNAVRRAAERLRS